MGEEYTLRDQVFRTFLENPSLGPREMAERLKANYNSVKAIYAQLFEEGLFNREGRGNYTPNLPRILVQLMGRVEALEKRLK